MSAFIYMYMLKQKPNAKQNMRINWILFFPVLADEFQQIRQVILITPAYTTMCIVYNLVIVGALMDCPAKQ